MIQNFEINDYRQFKNAKFDNFANVNLFVGENDTGKTTILKFLYAILSSLKELKSKNINDESILSYMHTSHMSIKSHILNEFEDKINIQPLKLNKLNLDNMNSDHFLCTLSNENNETITSNDNINNYNYDYKPLFIPAKEILSIMNAIAYLKYQNIESGFDDSYTDIIFEILAKKDIDYYQSLDVFKNNSKYNFYDGKIKIDKKTNIISFYKNDGNIYNINITAEGIKKLGIFEVLHSTGNLTKKSILFIDEPENSLHPKMVRELMRFLVDISKEGVQIFMASHNSFVLNQLSNIATKDDYPINVYFFLKKDNHTRIDGAYDLSKEFPDNSISDEAYDMFVESKN